MNAYSHIYMRLIIMTKTNIKFKFYILLTKLEII